MLPTVVLPDGLRISADDTPSNAFGGVDTSSGFRDAWLASSVDFWTSTQAA